MLTNSPGMMKRRTNDSPSVSFANDGAPSPTITIQIIKTILLNSLSLYDSLSIYTDKVSLSACYDISVTAMKTGYDNSDVATAKLYWLPSSGTLEGDNSNNVSMRGIAIQSAGGFVTISGLDNNETVSFYGIDGKALGSATAINGTTSFAAQSGSIVVAKIGKENIKIAVK